MHVLISDNPLFLTLFKCEDYNTENYLTVYLNRIFYIHMFRLPDYEKCLHKTMHLLPTTKLI